MKKSLLLGTTLLIASTSYASGFAILEQTPSGMGSSLAGMSADIDDPASTYFNPATSAWFSSGRISLGAHVLKADATYHDDAHRDNGGDMGGWSVIPNLYMVHPVNNRLAVSLGMSATSGTRTRYKRGWIGSTQALETEIQVATFNPAFSYRITDTLSFGAGFIVEYARALMTRSISPTIGELELVGDSFAMGYNIGLFFMPVEGTRFGIGYRSNFHHVLDMEAKFTNLPDDDAECILNLPAMINIGFQQDWDKFTFMIEACWTQWSQMDNLPVDFDTYDLMDSEQVMNWRDTWRLSFGIEYRLSEKISLRGGIAYDQSPVNHSIYRYASLPDANRYWLSCGIGYQYNERIRFDFGYLHIFFNKEDVNSYPLQGEVTGYANLFSLSMMYNF